MPAVAANPAPQYDPRRIPALHFSGKRLEYGELKLGSASFTLKPLQDGMALEDLKVDSDSFGMTGDGTWTVTPAGMQRSALNMDVKSRDVGKSLQALGFAPAITGSKGEMNADINWQDSPFGDLVHTLGGTIHVKLEDGQIVDVQPGAGRVFGLLSLNALPRRVLLNFSDVFSKGFGYDTIEGDFTLQDGDAYTKDMQVKGPAAKITLDRPYGSRQARFRRGPHRGCQRGIHPAGGGRARCRRGRGRRGVPADRDIQETAHRRRSDPISPDRDMG